MAAVKWDFSEWDEFFDAVGRAAGGEFRREIALFMEGLGMEFLRIVEDEIIRLKAVDTRLLLNSFHKGSEGNVWTMTDGGLTVEVGTNLDYASYVNDGHWTCKKGEKGRWVPGTWNGSRFVYDPGAKTGMYLKQKWVQGKPFWDSAVNIMEKMLPELMDRKIEQWMNEYFG